MSTEAPHPAITHITDDILLRRAQGGDADAFAIVYDRHAGPAYRVAARMLSPAAAEDVVQEAFITLWRTNAYDSRQGTVRSYLMTIVHNRAIDRLRRDSRRNREGPIDGVLEDQLPATGSCAETVERGEVRAVLRDAVSALPEEQRRTVELGYLAGLTHVEIAAALNVPLGTVKSRMRLGLGRLGRDASVAAIAA